MSDTGNIAAVMPGPPGVPIADENGNITVAWRGYFQVLQRRTGGTAGLATSDVAGAVTDEATARAAADAAEAATRAAADTAEATARTNADSAEASARTAADNALQANITAEAVTRASADAALLPKPAGGVTWTAGTGVPVSTQPRGSLFSRLDGAVGTTMYVSQGGGTWLSVAGV